MKSIAVTGALGSLGRRLVATFARKDNVERVVAYGRNEFALKIHEDFFKESLEYSQWNKIHWFAGDVRDETRMKKAFHGCGVVVHAAALKRVDGSLDNPTELKQTNIDGVMHALEAALSSGVRKFIFISSDKAVHPENIYGASKMLGEELVRAFNTYSYPRGMECLCVRYGNVLGSRGSVYWIWKKMMKDQRIPQLTDVAMTRYFMSFEDAIEVVLNAIYLGKAGQVLIPICPSYRLKEFLWAMYEVLEIPLVEPLYEIIGRRRGGEKLHESLVTERELYEGHYDSLRKNKKFLILDTEISKYSNSGYQEISQHLLSSGNRENISAQLSPYFLVEQIKELESDAYSWFDSLGGK